MESTTEHPGSSTTDNVSRIGDNISKWLGHLEWQRKGNSSKWQELCSPLKTHRPYQSWEELYSTLWSKWGWVVGVWCGDKSYQGNLKVMQYNDNTGKIDCWVRHLFPASKCRPWLGETNTWPSLFLVHLTLLIMILVFILRRNSRLCCDRREASYCWTFLTPVKPNRGHLTGNFHLVCLPA